MKKFRIIVMLLMAIIMGASFVSCNPDNGEEPTKKLVKFTCDEDETIFKYDDQGRLIECVNVWDFLNKETHTDTYTYVWGDNTIDVTFDRDNTENYSYTLKIENDLVSEYIFNSTPTSSLTYNSSNKLIKLETPNGSVSFEWTEDMITKINSDVLFDQGYDVYDYETNATTKGHNSILAYKITNEYLFVAHPELAGIATQKLFNRETNNILQVDGYGVLQYRYLYEFDADGYVNKVIVKHDEEDCEHIVSEYTFVWE